jgi:CMP-N-acetylneuraminic acid synthetase
MARDSSPVGQALLHAIDHLIPNADPRVTVVLVEPTSPLRPKGFIDKALTSYWASGADSAVSVGRSASQHPIFSATIAANGLLSGYGGGPLKYLRRQDIPEVNFLDGSFYATRLDHLRTSGQMYSGSILGIQVKKWQEIEIDDIDDFVMAESLGSLHSDEL